MAGRRAWTTQDRVRPAQINPRASSKAPSHGHGALRAGGASWPRRRGCRGPPSRIAVHRRIASRTGVGAEDGGRGPPAQDLEQLALVAGARACSARCQASSARRLALRPGDPGPQAPGPALAELVAVRGQLAHRPVRDPRAPRRHRRRRWRGSAGTAARRSRAPRAAVAVARARRSRPRRARARRPRAGRPRRARRPAPAQRAPGRSSGASSAIARSSRRAPAGRSPRASAPRAGRGSRCAASRASPRSRVRCGRARPDSGTPARGGSRRSRRAPPGAPPASGRALVQLGAECLGSPS